MRSFHLARLAIAAASLLATTSPALADVAAPMGPEPLAIGALAPTIDVPLDGFVVLGVPNSPCIAFDDITATVMDHSTDVVVPGNLSVLPGVVPQVIWTPQTPMAAVRTHRVEIEVMTSCNGLSLSRTQFFTTGDTMGGELGELTLDATQHVWCDDPGPEIQMTLDYADAVTPHYVDVTVRNPSEPATASVFNDGVSILAVAAADAGCFELEAIHRVSGKSRVDTICPDQLAPTKLEACHTGCSAADGAPMSLGWVLLALLGLAVANRRYRRSRVAMSSSVRHTR